MKALLILSNSPTLCVFSTSSEEIILSGVRSVGSDATEDAEVIGTSADTFEGASLDSSTAELVDGLLAVTVGMSSLDAFRNLFPHDWQLYKVTRIAFPLPLLGTTSHDLLTLASSLLHLGQIVKICSPNSFIEIVKLRIVCPFILKMSFKVILE